MHNPLLMHAGLADEHTRADIAAAKLTPRGMCGAADNQPLMLGMTTALADRWVMVPAQCMLSHLCAGNSLPPVVHARAAAAGRIVCIGDIHGCLHEVRVPRHKCWPVYVLCRRCKCYAVTRHRLSSSDACTTTPQDLLSKCKFQQEHDTLVLVGDLVRCSTLRSIHASFSRCLWQSAQEQHLCKHLECR